MERLLQYLDDLDDLIGAFGLIAEKIRDLLWRITIAVLLVVAAATGFAAALAEPPLALAVALLLFVFLLYRSVTAPVASRIPLEAA